ncbi:MAG: DUF262 domain-containing protein [bacterium]|nr:DUF262 domain-containing protein [bacterium]
MAADEELQRAPTYQRKFRWDEAAESRFIESLFLGLPVPSVFVAANADGTWEVIDGLQRISTLLHFTERRAGALETINRKTPLSLSGLEKLSGFNGKTFDKLPMPMQLKFWKRMLRITALSDKSNPNVRFDMFERLNTGGVILTAQEVRACIFQGPFNDLLRELAASDGFKKLVKLQKKKQADGTREELALKFFAYLENRDEFNGAVSKFLNGFMQREATSRDTATERRLFTKVVETLLDFCGGPFLRAGYANTPQNQLEAIMVAAGELMREGTVLQPREGWQNDAELVRASSKGTNTPKMLNLRIRRARELLTGTSPILA